MSVCGTVGHTLKLRRFSWNRALKTPLLRRRTLLFRLDLVYGGFPYHTSSLINPNSIKGSSYCNPSLHRMCAGHGILTVCPSGAVFTIPLGPTNPKLITIASETLLFRRAGFSPALWLLVPAFSLRNAPAWVTPLPSSQMQTLSYRLYAS